MCVVDDDDWIDEVPDIDFSASTSLLLIQFDVCILFVLLASLDFSISVVLLSCEVATCCWCCCRCVVAPLTDDVVGTHGKLLLDFDDDKYIAPVNTLLFVFKSVPDFSGFEFEFVPPLIVLKNPLTFSVTFLLSLPFKEDFVQFFVFMNFSWCAVSDASGTSSIDLFGGAWM